MNKGAAAESVLGVAGVVLVVGAGIVVVTDDGARTPDAQVQTIPTPDVPVGSEAAAVRVCNRRTGAAFTDAEFVRGVWRVEEADGGASCTASRQITGGWAVAAVTQKR